MFSTLVEIMVTQNTILASLLSVISFYPFTTKYCQIKTYHKLYAAFNALKIPFPVKLMSLFITTLEIDNKMNICILTSVLETLLFN